MQVLRVEVIVFNCVCRFKDNSVFKTFYGVESIKLDFQRKGRGETLKVIFGSF